MGPKARHCMTQRQYVQSVQQVEGLSHVVKDLMRLGLEVDLRLGLESKAQLLTRFCMQYSSLSF